MSHTPIIDWEVLSLPEYESREDTNARLADLVQANLKAQGLDHKTGGVLGNIRPNSSQAREVAVMSCLGLDEKAIAHVLNVSVKTLKLFYAKELKVSASLANAMVARQALAMAMDGQHADMTKFWLKSRAGWTETNKVELTGKDGGAIEMSSAKDRLKAMLAAKAVKGGK